MTLVKLDLRPGVVRDSTSYSNTGGWYSSNRVRFRGGKPESIGGWQPYTTEAFVGKARTLFRFSDNSGNIYTFIGTTVKCYIESGTQLYDVTPVRATSALNGCFDTTDGSAVVTVTDTSHGASIGDYIIISGSAAVGGITPSGEYVVATVVEQDRVQLRPLHALDFDHQRLSDRLLFTLFPASLRLCARTLLWKWLVARGL